MATESNGGAISIFSSILTIKNSNFSNFSSVLTGGVISAFLDSTIKLIDT